MPQEGAPMFAASPSEIRVYDLRRQELLAEVNRHRSAAAARSDRSGGRSDIAGPGFKRVVACALAALSSIAFGLHTR